MRSLSIMNAANALVAKALALPPIWEQWHTWFPSRGGRGQKQALHPCHSPPGDIPEGLRESNDDGALLRRLTDEDCKPVSLIHLIIRIQPYDRYHLCNSNHPVVRSPRIIRLGL